MIIPLRVVNFRDMDNNLWFCEHTWMEPLYLWEHTRSGCFSCNVWVAQVKCVAPVVAVQYIWLAGSMNTDYILVYFSKSSLFLQERVCNSMQSSTVNVIACGSLREPATPEAIDYIHSRSLVACNSNIRLWSELCCEIVPLISPYILFRQILWNYIQLFVWYLCQWLLCLSAASHPIM